MTQRVRTPNGLNLETVVCEKYMARLLENDVKIRTNSANSRSREKNAKQPCVSPTAKSKTYSKIVSHTHKVSQSPRNLLEYSDDNALVKVTVKAAQTRHRSRNRSIEHEPWGQILKYEKSNEKLSVFNNFDPLRTLHFLIKELELHLHRVLSKGDDNSISQIIQDMHSALKRVPPEVASIIHLQQARDGTPNILFAEKETQTTTYHNMNESIKKHLEESIKKFEAKYGELENICSKLRNEKYEIESQLIAQTETSQNYKQKIEDLENNSNSFLAPKIRTLEKEKERLESDIECLALNYETRYNSLVNELKVQVSDLKTAKVTAEQENVKLKHQMRVMNLEKEKYVTVLAARDRQINEIRSEMSHLQEAVNEQLMELQKNASKTFPNTSVKTVNDKVKKENIGDWSVSYSNNDDDELLKRSEDKSVGSLKDLPSGDVDNFVEHHSKSQGKDKNVMFKPEDDISALLEKMDSHTSIRSMFNEVKRTAMSISNSSNYQFSSENNSKI